MKRILFLLILILLVTACRRGGNEEADQENTNGSIDTVGVLPDGDSITIAISMWEESRFRTIASAFTAYMAEQGREVKVDFITYMQDEEEDHFNRIFGMLAAGVGPDIMTIPSFRLWPLIQNDLLADINTIINRSDFYENVLDSYEINGKLYTIPMSFGFNFIGINSKVPQSFIDRFAEFEQISLMDIANIYYDLITEYPEFAEYSIGRSLWPGSAIRLELGQNIDFNARTVSFNHLHDFITNITRIFEHNEWIDIPHVFPQTDETVALMAEHYIFSSETDLVEAMFPFNQAHFLHYIPLSDMQGNLVESAFTQSISISNTASPLVGIFIEHFFKVDDFSTNMSIMRENMRDNLEQTINQNLQWREPRPFLGEQFINIQNMLDRLEIYAERPIAQRMAGELLPWEVTVMQPEELEEFIINWLNEIHDIEPYIPETDTIPEGMNIRNLTVRSSNDFRAVIEQARDMLNADWEEKGQFLVINFEEHEVLSFDAGWEAYQAASEAREARFRTELMAGMAPDLVFNDGFPLHQFAQGGHLVDFYTLIDNLDDYFANAFTANEFKGGLYELPMIFEFRYIGINENVPQDIIDMFTLFPYIKASDLIDIYFEFIDNNEFLYFDMHLIQPYMLNIMNYVNFNTNTADFSTGFIESITQTNRLEFDVHFSRGGSTSFFPIADTSHIRGLAGERMFLADNHGLSTADAFLKRDILFDHFRPLANDYGSLVVNFGEGGGSFSNSLPLVWIPSAGDVELAWELTEYLIKAFAEPVGRAAVLPGWGMSAPWGTGSFSIPIIRSAFENNLRATFNALTETWNFSEFGFPEEGDEFDQAVQIAINRVYEYANMPMVIREPHLPMDLLWGPLGDFMMEIITADETAARMQNAITLWLME